MNRAESSPAYIARCIEALLDALCEAHALARAGHLDGRFSETVRFASDLLDIIAEGKDAFADDPTSDTLNHVRDRVTAVRALFPTSSTVH